MVFIIVTRRGVNFVCSSFTTSSSDSTGTATELQTELNRLASTGLFIEQVILHHTV